MYLLERISQRELKESTAKASSTRVMGISQRELKVNVSFFLPPREEIVNLTKRIESKGSPRSCSNTSLESHKEN